MYKNSQKNIASFEARISQYSIQSVEVDKKINYYLEHDEQRESIRMAGHNRTKTDHTYVHRWTAILKELGTK